MPSKTSSFKKEIFKQDFRNVGWVGIIYLLGLLFTLPLQLLMALGSDYGAEPSEAGLIGSIFIFELQSIFLFTMPVLMAVFLFRYMHVKASSDFTHSLPIKREKLFNYHLISGFILLIGPILITGVIMGLFSWFMDVSDFYSFHDLGYWLLLMIITTILIFMSSVLVGTLTGLSAVQAVLTFVLLLFPIGIYGLIVNHVSFYIKGISAQFNISEKLSPIVDSVTYGRSLDGMIPIEYIPLGIYFGLSILLYFAARFSYKKRQLEAASQAIAVFALKPVFKYGVTFCFTLFGGMYFGETERTMPWLIFGYIVGGIIGYFAAVMLLEKTWRVFSIRHMKGMAGYGLLVAVIVMALPFLWNSYEKHIPNAAKVEAAYIGNSFYQYEDFVQAGRDTLIQSESGIEAVRKVHKSLIEAADPLDIQGRNYYLHYELKNGEKVQRSYQVEPLKIKQAMMELVQTKAYKNLQYPITQLSPNGLLRITIEPELYPGTQASIVDQTQIEAFLEVVKADIYELSYEEMLTPTGISSHVNIIDEDNQFYDVSLDASYTRTIDWLKEQGLYEQAYIQAEDIDRVEIYPWKVEAEHPHGAVIELKQQGVEPLTVTNAEKIKAALTGNNALQKQDYLVAIYPKMRANEPQVLSFTEEDVPAFIKEHFND